MNSSLKNVRERYRLQHPELDEMTDQLVAKAQEAWGAIEGADYVRQFLATGLRLIRDKVDPRDLKLLNNAMKEMRHALHVFAPFEQVRKVAVFGSARTAPDQAPFQMAKEFAERIVNAGWMVITGAGPGIMEAAQGGAGRKRSFGVNIRLPFEQHANPHIAGDMKLINFRYFFTRKVTFVKESHAIVLFPGGFGTHDEGFETLTLVQTGKAELVPVVFVDAPGGTYWKDWDAYVRGHLRAKGLISPEDVNLYLVTDSVEAAVGEVLNFYSNYHSSRFVGRDLVLRVRRAPTRKQLATLNERYARIVVDGAMEVTDPLPEENGDAPGLPRLVFRYNRRDQGVLRLLVNDLNALVPETSSADPAAPPQIVPQDMSPHDEEEEQDDRP